MTILLFPNKFLYCFAILPSDKITGFYPNLFFLGRTDCIEIRYKLFVPFANLIQNDPLRHDERINCPFWLVLFAPCCVAHHSGSFGYPHSSRLAWHKNYCPIIEHFILSSCLSVFCMPLPVSTQSTQSTQSTNYLNCSNICRALLFCGFNSNDRW